MSSEPRPSRTVFEPHIGRPFRVRVDGHRVIELTLVEATDLPPATHRDDLPIRNDPFSLVFRGDADAQLEQRMYVVEHEATGPMDMFLVPIGFGDYEAVFN